MDYLLDVDGLKKSFSGVSALKDGRFQLAAGSVHALCGGNGAGKSTFLKILMGSTSGTAVDSSQRCGVELQQTRATRLHQVSPSLSRNSARSHMTVAENIYLGREPRDVSVASTSRR